LRRGRWWPLWPLSPLPLRGFGVTLGFSGKRVRQLKCYMLTRLRIYIGATERGELRRAA